MIPLTEIVRQDVLAFLKSNEELFFNERDFQIHLAIWLRNSAYLYDDVDVEYYVPKSELENYIWNSELRLDIVVKKNGEYCPIELKYKTKRIERKIKRFDEELNDKIVIVKNQGAQDLGMYDFWKDVRRVELVCNRFEKVNGGLVVFITNDGFYIRCSKEPSNNYLLNMTDGVHSKQKCWVNPESACAKTHPNFEVEKEYTIEWHNKVVDGIEFYCCIITI